MIAKRKWKEKQNIYKYIQANSEKQATRQKVLMWCNAFTFYVSIISFQVGSLPKIEYLIDKSTTLAYSEMMFTISLRIVNAVVPLPSEIPPQWFHVFDGHSVRLYQAANTIYLIHSSFFAFVVPKNWKK